MSKARGQLSSRKIGVRASISVKDAMEAQGKTSCRQSSPQVNWADAINRSHELLAATHRKYKQTEPVVRGTKAPIQKEILKTTTLVMNLTEVP